MTKTTHGWWKCGHVIKIFNSSSLVWRFLSSSSQGVQMSDVLRESAWKWGKGFSGSMEIPGGCIDTESIWRVRSKAYSLELEDCFPHDGLLKSSESRNKNSLLRNKYINSHVLNMLLNAFLHKKRFLETNSRPRFFPIQNGQLQVVPHTHLSWVSRAPPKEKPLGGSDLKEIPHQQPTWWVETFRNGSQIRRWISAYQKPFKKRLPFSVFSGFHGLSCRPHVHSRFWSLTQRGSVQ